MKDKHILIVVTNGYQMENGQLAGIWMSEFVEPYKEFAREGFQITVASPNGGSSLVDPSSLEGEVPEEWIDYEQLLLQTTPLSDITAKDYAGIFLPGGHGAMFDLPKNVHLQNLLTDFSKSNKPIAAVCHGPAGLLGAHLDTGNPLLEGKKVTGFTNAEEAETQRVPFIPFLLETKMKELEAKFIAGPNGQDHVEVDGLLVTGQNPQSSRSVAREFLKLLEAYLYV